METATDGWTAGRRQSSWIGAIVAAIVVLGAFVYVWMSPDHKTSTTAASPSVITPVSVPPSTVPASPTPSPTATATVRPTGCVWAPNTEANPSLTKTGTPPTKNIPTSGTRDLVLNTTQGTITITLDLKHAPCAAASFGYLAGQKYFDGSTCHRMTTSGIFVLQCGDPSGTGSGGPSYTFAGETFPGAAGTSVTYPTAIVAMANPGDRDLNGSQFFIVFKDSPLAADYSAIGTVTGGMDVVQKVAKAGVTAVNSQTDGTPKLPVKIITATVGPIKN